MGRPKKIIEEAAEVVAENAKPKEVEAEPEYVEEEIETKIQVGEKVFIDLDVPGVGVLVECKPSEREKAAQDAFAYLEGIADAGQPVLIKNEECGNSIEFTDIEAFPQKNRACGCGNKLHSAVRYKFI